MILVGRERGLNRANSTERWREAGKDSEGHREGEKDGMVDGWGGWGGREKDTVGEIAGERERKREWWDTRRTLR